MSEDGAEGALEHGHARSRLWDRALVAGGALWLVAVVICMNVNDERLTTVLMPLWAPVSLLAGPGFNIGTADKPMYETTPVQAFAGLAGIGLSAIVYVSLLYVLLRWRQHRASLRVRD
jgi:hypothetical protein